MKPDKQFFKTWIDHVVGLLIVLALLAASAITRDDQLLGTPRESLFSKQTSATTIAKPTEQEQKLMGLTPSRLKELEPGIWRCESGETVVSSMPFASKVVGYTGNTPVFIALDGNKIVGITATKNRETRQYWHKIVRNGNLHHWDNLDIADAIDTAPDAVSGATISSRALNQTVQKTLAAVAGKDLSAPTIQWDLKLIAGLIVIAIAVILSLFIKNRKLRWLQLALNVLILGLFCGTFINMSLLIGWMSNGINLTTSIVAITLVTLAIIMPFFGKRQFYCTQICPFGSAQELMGLCRKSKWHIPSKALTMLSYLRHAILGAILMLMWLSIYSEAIDYELFTAFLLTEASPWVIGAAVAVMILSIFINRPYCRFVCPTGTLLKLQEKIQ